MTTLHPDLAIYLETDGPFPMIRHPLVFSVPYFDVMNEHLNLMYEHKKKKINECMVSGDLETVVYLHERPYRLNALLSIRSSLTPAQFANLLRSVWVDSENVHENLETWVELWDEVEDRASIMEEPELEQLSKLDSEVTIYRGFRDTVDAANGISWTTDRKTAEWFANRFSKTPYIAEATVEKSDIIALILSRGENEVVTLNPKITSVTKL